MAKYAALIILVLVAVCAAKPMGYGMGVVHKNHHMSSHIISPYMGMGLGYGMMGLGYGMGHMGHLGHMGHMGHMMGMKGLGMGMYPMGIGMGYGMMG